MPNKVSVGHHKDEGLSSMVQINLLKLVIIFSDYEVSYFIAIISILNDTHF